MPANLFKLQDLRCSSRWLDCLQYSSFPALSRQDLSSCSDSRSFLTRTTYFFYRFVTLYGTVLAQFSFFYSWHYLGLHSGNGREMIITLIRYVSFTFYIQPFLFDLSLLKLFQRISDAGTLRAKTSDIAILIFGATCQQGSPVELKGFKFNIFF